MAILRTCTLNQHEVIGHFGVTKALRRLYMSPLMVNTTVYYPTLLPRVQISRGTSTNNRYLYSPHSSWPREVQNLGKSDFWEKKSLDNKSLIRRFGV